MMDPIEHYREEVLRALGTAVLQSACAKGELSIIVTRARIVEVLEKLRDDPGVLASQLMDVSAVDYPSRPERYEVVYQLLSLLHNKRLRVKIRTDGVSPILSVTGVYKSAGWFEREVWDMFGISFSGHPDLRRILTDYDFEGHPLQKDFPLMGTTEVRYDPDQRRIVYEPVKLQQDFRAFDFQSPWEGMTDVQTQRSEEEERSAKQ